MSDISQGTVYVTAEMLTGQYFNIRRRGMRGVNIYTLSDLLQVVGESRDGRQIGGQIQQNLFSLSLDERVQIYRKCAPVYGLVTGRANRIAGLKWKIRNVTKEQDRSEAFLKMAAEVFREWNSPTNVKHAFVRLRARAFIRRYLPDVLDDMSNFNASLLRWKRRSKMTTEDECTRVEDWIANPNNKRTFKEFTVESIVDLCVHGAAAWFKSRDARGKIANVDNLPGGTVLPFRSAFVGGSSAFAQIINGVPPKIYFRDEVTFLTYAANSALSYGTVPLEALVNRIAEFLLFEEQAAMKADGTSAPEKLIVMNEMFPYGDEDVQRDLNVPLSREEQSRIETLVNEPRRNAIRVLTGHGGAQGQPAVVDLSRADTFAAQSEREEKTLRTVAIVFNASNVEINLTGSDNTSGRETSENQQESDQAKGWLPLAVGYEEKWNREILPETVYGPDYEMDIDKGLSEKEQVALEQAKMQTGTYATNQVREDRDDEPWPEPEYDRPPSGAQKAPAPDGSKGNPLSVVGMEMRRQADAVRKVMVTVDRAMKELASRRNVVVKGGDSHPITVNTPPITINTPPVTVNMPEVHVSPPSVTVQPASIHVDAPKPQDVNLEVRVEKEQKATTRKIELMREGGVIVSAKSSPVNEGE